MVRIAHESGRGGAIAWRARLGLVLGGMALAACGGSLIPESLPSSTSQETDWPPLQTSVEPFAIDFDSAAAAIVYEPSRGHEWVPGVFTAGGEAKTVELRQRGQGARYHPKHSWKVKLPKKETYEDYRAFNYLAEWLDSGYLSDAFSYALMQASGVPAPEARFVTLAVTGTYQGVYTQLEDVDELFLAHHGFDADSNIYRCGERDCEMKITPPAHYQAAWEKHTNEAEPMDDLAQFLHEISRTPEGEFEAWAARRLDLDAFLRYMAANALVSNHGITTPAPFSSTTERPIAGRWFPGISTIV